MQNRKSAILFLLCLSLPVSALADSIAENLSRIETETLLLKAREKQLEAQVQIATRQAEVDRLVRTAGAGDPTILSIEGIGNSIYTTLQLDNGNMIDAKVGDVLPNGMKIVSIRANEVIVEAQKKRRIRLATGMPSNTTFNPSYQATGSSMPPLPPLAPTRGTVR